MKKWWKARSRQEKWMMVIIVMLITGIILRWQYISSEVGKIFKNPDKEQVESVTDVPENME